MDQVDPQVKDAITINNVKTIAEAGAFAMGSLFQHQTNTAHRLDQLAEGYLGCALDNFASVDPVESVSTSKLFKGESDSAIASLLAQLATGSVGTKIAQSTPGDVSIEISKLGASVASLQALISSLVAILQVTLKGAQSTPPQTAIPVTPVTPAKAANAY
jgi:hypothetical protein